MGFLPFLTATSMLKVRVTITFVWKLVVYDIFNRSRDGHGLALIQEMLLLNMQVLINNFL